METKCGRVGVYVVSGVVRAKWGTCAGTFQCAAWPVYDVSVVCGANSRNV